VARRSQAILGPLLGVIQDTCLDDTHKGRGRSRKLSGRLQPTTDPRLVFQVLLPEGALQVTLLALYLITLDQQQH
jgi:hypothetical protein